MKLQQLRKIIREEVKGAIQEELKEILLEAIKNPSNGNYTPSNTVEPVLAKPIVQPKSVEATRSQIKEGYKNILGETAAAFNTSNLNKPLQMTGNIDTASPNGALPEGEVSFDQIQGLMTGK